MTENLSNIEILNWFIDAGIDVTIAEEPVDLTNFKKENTKVIAQPAIAAKKPETIIEKPTNKRQATTLDSETVKAIEIAKSISDKASSLEELKSEIEKFEGCSLKFTAANTVFGAGDSNARIMIIGEAPDSDDDRSGKIYSGKTGNLLDNILKSIGFERNSCYLSNILPWRPPGNRTPNEAEINICMPFILKQIELVDPEYIILLGGNAANYVLETNEPISKIRGKWLEVKVKEKTIKSIVIFQPSYLLKNTKQKRKTWLDLIRIKKII